MQEQRNEAVCAIDVPIAAPVYLGIYRWANATDWTSFELTSDGF